MRRRRIVDHGWEWDRFVGRSAVLLPALMLSVAATKPPPVKMPPTSPETVGAAPTPIQARRIDALFARWNRPTTPGCALDVQRNGVSVVTRAYGSVDLEHVSPIMPGTIFEAGSVSKQFTAAAILLLAEDGKLKLDDDVRKYVPELPDYPAPIRIRHLLNHTSGLRDWGAIGQLAGWPRGTAAYDMDDVLAIIARQKALNFTPGSEYSYSNSGYSLLALIVSRVSGTSFPRFTADRIFKPLGMTHSGWRDNFRRILPGRAVAYAARGVVYEQDMPFESAYGNGGLLTTVGDLGRWTQALMDNRLGRNVAADLRVRGRLSDGQEIAYARGQFVTQFAGLPEISHSGSTAGYRAWLAYYPTRRISVALLCSTADANTPDLGRAVAAALIGPTPEPPEKAYTGDPKLVGETAGLYLDPHDQPLTIVADQGKLRIAGGGALFPLATDRFRLGDDRELRLAAPGELYLRSPDGGVRYTRVASNKPKVLTDFAGRYSSEEVGATYKVEAKGNEITLQLESRPGVVLQAKPIGADLFETRGGVIRFRRDGEGRPEAFAISIARAFDVRFTRIRN